MRREQAWNDGRLAFRQGVPWERCPRRNGVFRAAWYAGFEHERGRDARLKIDPLKLLASERVARRLGLWVREWRESERATAAQAH